MSIRVRVSLAPLLVAALASCAAWQPAPGVQQERAAASGTCHAERVQWAVGQVATSEVTGRVWRERHAGLIRPLRPEQTAERDMRPDHAGAGPRQHDPPRVLRLKSALRVAQPGPDSVKHLHHCSVEGKDPGTGGVSTVLWWPQGAIEHRGVHYTPRDVP